MNEQKLEALITKLLGRILPPMLDEILPPMIEKYVRAETHTNTPDMQIVRASTTELAQKNMEITLNKCELMLKSTIKDIVPLITNKVAGNVYRAINKNINDTIVPCIAGINERLEYFSMDGDEVVDSFRRVAMKAEETPMLAIGDANRVIISPHISYAFAEDH